MVDSSIGIVIILLLLVQLLVQFFYQRRQAMALDATRDIEEKRYFLHLRRHRDETAAGKLVGGGKGWLERQTRAALGLDLALDGRTIILKALPVAAVYSDGAESVLVASPLSPRDVRKKLAHLTKQAGALSGHTEDGEVLGLLKKAKRTGRRSLADDQFLDIFAEKAGKDLGVNWKDIDAIYLSVAQL